MATTLTQDDLHSIKELVDSSIDERVPKIIGATVPPIIEQMVPALVQPMLDNLQLDTRFNNLESRLVQRIDELDDTFSRQTEHGLQEVRDQVTEVGDHVAGVQQTVTRIERVQQAEIARVNRQSTAIKQIRKTLRAV